MIRTNINIKNIFIIFLMLTALSCDPATKFEIVNAFPYDVILKCATDINFSFNGLLKKDEKLEILFSYRFIGENITIEDIKMHLREFDVYTTDGKKLMDKEDLTERNLEKVRSSGAFSEYIISLQQY